MGATITTGKLAAAFQRTNGTVVYVLFEKTHEANCYPHDPSWHCIAIGEYADVLFNVFGHASGCEGGGLQGSGGRLIKPENYIAAWRRELVNPVSFPDRKITLDANEQMDGISVREALSLIGRDDIFADNQTEPAHISLHEDVDVVLALYGVNKPNKPRKLSPWQILNHSSALTLPMPELGAQVSIEKIDPPAFNVLRIDQEEVLVQLGNGQWQQWGWQYAAVGRYIQEVAYKSEMMQTGSSKRLIAEFRDACDTARAVPEDTKLHITRNPEGVHAWNQESFDTLAKELGIGAGQPVTEIECTFAEVKANENAARNLNYLVQSQVIWDVPVMPVSEPTSQLDLLAA